VYTWSQAAAAKARQRIGPVTVGDTVLCHMMVTRRSRRSAAAPPAPASALRIAAPRTPVSAVAAQSLALEAVFVRGCGASSPGSFTRWPNRVRVVGGSAQDWLGRVMRSRPAASWQALRLARFASPGSTPTGQVRAGFIRAHVRRKEGAAQGEGG
jgi:hypothetical protein